jgi:hypothetical protein
MDVDVHTDIEIERPRSEVADYVSDPDNATAWYENIKKVEWKSPKALKVGAKVAFEARFMGRTMAYTYEIQGVRTGPIAGNEHGGGTLPDGDELHVLRDAERRDDRGAAQPGPPIGIRDHRRPRDGGCNEASESQRPRSTEVDS